MSRLVAEHLAVSAGDRLLLDDISLAIEPGTLTGLIGPNGAGKSTLLRCLAGLLRPQAGTITLDGVPVATLPATERGRRIGYLPQAFNPAWDYTVRELVELGASRRPGAATSIAKSLRDHGLEDLANRPLSRVSGGEKARALLAATLVADPQVLLADEPGASLDIAHRLDLMRRLQAYASTHAVVIVLHDIERATRDCNRLVLLQHGRIVESGPAETLAQSSALDRVFGVRFKRIALEPHVDAVISALKE